MKITIDNIGGDVVKQDDRYTVVDNKVLNNLVLSSTRLNPGKSTSGHEHVGQEEVYYFINGTGTMELAQKNNIKTLRVKPGDVVLIEDGVFHRVHAGADEMYFVCVFDGARDSKHYKENVK